MKTWVYEQSVLLALLAPSIAVGIAADPTAIGVARAAVLAGAALYSQKSRSAADRRREQDELRGLARSVLRCDAADARNAALAQALAICALVLGGLRASSRWGYLAAALPLLYTLAYPTWRVWYRARRPALRERARAGTHGPDPLSPEAEARLRYARVAIADALGEPLFDVMLGADYHGAHVTVRGHRLTGESESRALAALQRYLETAWAGR